jgi:hypothetical protein
MQTLRRVDVMRFLPGFAIAMIAAVSLSGCGSDPLVDAEARCRAESGCKGARAQDACVDDWETAAEALYSRCTAELQSWLDCGATEGRCDGEGFQDSPACDREYADLGTCMNEPGGS